GSIDSPNLYLYVRNSPLNRLDLFGLYSAPPMPWSSRGEDSPRLEIFISDVQLAKFGDGIRCRGSIGGVEVDCVVSFDHWHKLMFTAEEIGANKVNIFDHLYEIFPKEGSEIGLWAFINGINTIFNDMDTMTSSIAKEISEGTLGLGLYNPTEGFFKDVFRAVKELIGIETSAVARMRQVVCALSDVLAKVNPDMLMAVFLHSEAGVILKNGIEGMTEKQQQTLQKQMVCVTFGPAAPLSKQHALDAMNFYSEEDKVTKWFNEHYLTDPNYDIQIVKCQTPLDELDFLIRDHGFLKPTYQQSLRNEIGRKRDSYGFYNAR
ncbi:MAG: hypothetical protein JSR93_02955, partial [Verrucomicrobia bacterium]|nr:hypothetical protein [Verrucomicrobiota bacterium]